MTIIDNIKGLFVSKVDNVEETNKWLVAKRRKKEWPLQNQ
jgi:hypothetical protein